MFAEVMLEAAAKSSRIIADREKELVGNFKAKGINVIEVDTDAFRKIVVQKVPFEQYGYQKADWDRIQALK